MDAHAANTSAHVHARPVTLVSYARVQQNQSRRDDDKMKRPRFCGVTVRKRTNTTHHGTRLPTYVWPPALPLRVLRNLVPACGCLEHSTNPPAPLQLLLRLFPWRPAADVTECTEPNPPPPPPPLLLLLLLLLLLVPTPPEYTENVLHAYSRDCLMLLPHHPGGGRPAATRPESVRVVSAVARCSLLAAK